MTRTRRLLLPSLCCAALASLSHAAADATTTTTTTLPAADPEILLDLDFAPGRLSRTLVQGVVGVPAHRLTANELGFYNVELAGEVLVAGRRYDHFKYRFDVDASEGSEAPLALTFQRQLRPGDYRLALAVVDLESGVRLLLERPLAVPRTETGGGEEQPAAPPVPAEGSSGVAAVGEPVLSVLPLPPVVVGTERVTAVCDGCRPAAVRFVVDEGPAIEKLAPPFSVELDFGNEQSAHVLRVEAYGDDGRLLAASQVDVNTGPGRLAVRLLEPSRKARAGGRLAVRAAADVPQGSQLERIDLFLDERRLESFRTTDVATWVDVPADRMAVLRVAAALADGRTADDAVLLNAPPGLEEIDVDLVELYAAVVDRRGTPVRGLGREAFRVLEDGVLQRVERFEAVDDLPMDVGLVIDVSASMEQRLGQVSAAARAFLDAAMRPGDRAMLVPFSSSPHLAVPLCDDLRRLGNGLTNLRAGGDTSLYDALTFTLERLPSRGQRAILLLSDGIDVASRATARSVFELARRMGVTIYTIGMVASGPSVDRELLTRLAEETGGRSFFVREGDELPEAFAAIQDDVRSRYLLTYYSSNEDTGFRHVALEVAPRELEARTIMGYYP